MAVRTLLQGKTVERAAALVRAVGIDLWWTYLAQTLFLQQLSWSLSSLDL